MTGGHIEAQKAASDMVRFCRRAACARQESMQDANEVTTRRLYYDDAYATEFSGTVIDVRGNEVVLDQTLFFPEEGGQTADTGSLDGFRVKDVQIRDGVICHIMDLSAWSDGGGQAIEKKSGEDFVTPEEAAQVFYKGKTVQGHIDWDRRFSAMQQHTGEHIFSGLVHRKFGYDNVGFHLSDREVTVDFNGPLTYEEAVDIEMQANRVITSGRETEIGFYSREERAHMDYRSKLDLDGEVRIVTIPGVDRCACCAPHVARTGEIGLLKVVSVQNYKGGTRVSILCGDRAMGLFEKSWGWLTETANTLTAAREEVPSLVRKEKEEILALRQALKTADTERLYLKAAAGGEASQRRRTEVPEDTASPDMILLFEQRADDKAARDAVTKIVSEKDVLCGIFIGTDEDGYRYIIGSADGSAGDVNKTLRSEFGARGGGKPGMVQGSCAASAGEIRRTLSAL